MKVAVVGPLGLALAVASPTESAGKGLALRIVPVACAVRIVASGGVGEGDGEALDGRAGRLGVDRDRDGLRDLARGEGQRPGSDRRSSRPVPWRCRRPWRKSTVTGWAEDAVRLTVKVAVVVPLARLAITDAGLINSAGKASGPRIVPVPWPLGDGGADGVREVDGEALDGSRRPARR